MSPDDFWARKRKEEQREEEEAQERAEEQARQLKQAGIRQAGRRSGEAPIATKFDELIKSIPVLIDQLEHLYRQFATGVLARPPIEQRGRLDHMLVLLTNAAKATAADRFRFSGVQQSYSTHKSRWDKLLADVESGKIKRVAGPKKGPQSL